MLETKTNREVDFNSSLQEATLPNRRKPLALHAVAVGKSTVRAVLLGAVLVSPQGALHAQARAYMGSITLPTYGEGAPDPNPPFDVYASEDFNYPTPCEPT